MLYTYNLVLLDLYSFVYMGISFFLTETLKHVAATVAGVKLSDHVVELVFTLFDENGEICVHQIIMYYCRSQEIYVMGYFTL